MSDASLIVPLRQRETMITILHLHTVQVKSFFTIIFRQCPKEILSKNAHKARYLSEPCVFTKTKQILYYEWIIPVITGQE